MTKEAFLRRSGCHREAALHLGPNEVGGGMVGRRRAPSKWLMTAEVANKSVGVTEAAPMGCGAVRCV